MTAGARSHFPTPPWPEALCRPLRALQGESLLYIALSGGLDSVVLLHAAVHCLEPGVTTLRAVHVNHQLQPNAAETEAHCQRLCRRLGVELLVERVTVAGGQGSGSGIEEAARNARYRVFENLLNAGGALVMAHHQDDQAETLLFRLIRGSGLAGLAGMPASRQLGRGKLYRPFLHVPRCELLAWAEACGMSWVDDPSNADQRFDRNFLRHTIIPHLKARWPTLLARLDRSAEACREGAELAASLARLQFREVGTAQGLLDVASLTRLSLSEQKNLLRWWIVQAGFRPPELQDWSQVLSELTLAADDREPELRGEGFSVRRFQGRLHLVTHQSVPTNEYWLRPGEWMTWGEWKVILRPVAAGDREIPRIRMASRQGGERIRPRPGGPSKPLKKWLQEQAVPPWERARLPVLSENDELVAVGSEWVSQRYCGDAPESGWQIVVERECD